MSHVENLERRVHFSANPVAARVKTTPSIDIAVSSVSSSFGTSSKPGAKGIETLAVQNLSGIPAHGRITFELSISDSAGDYYVLHVTQPTRVLSLRPQATKTFRVRVALPSSMPNASDYVVTGFCNVLSGFTDPEPGNNGINFSATPISISSGASGGNIGYFTFLPFSATQVVGSARVHLYDELGTVTAYPGGEVQYTYTYSFGTGTLQIASTSSDEFALFYLTIYHHAPTKLNGKTITIVASAKGATGSGSLIEEGFAVPGLTWNEQVAYYKLK